MRWMTTTTDGFAIPRLVVEIRRGKRGQSGAPCKLTRLNRRYNMLLVVAKEGKYRGAKGKESQKEATGNDDDDETDRDAVCPCQEGTASSEEPACTNSQQETADVAKTPRKKKLKMDD
jgi:hypothetical protein